MPVPKDEKLNPINAPSALPYEFQFAQSPTPMHQLTSQYPTLQYPTQQSQQAQQQTQSQQNQPHQKELNKIKRKALIGAVLLFIPIINLIGIGLLIDALIHYLKLRSR